MEHVITPPGYHTANPFIITQDAKALITFLKKVFSARENTAVLVVDESDGKIFHSEVTIGDTLIMIADRKKNWPYTPGMMQIYVNDIDKCLRIAEEEGAEVVTHPTLFLGGSIARFIDAWGNLWWVLYMPKIDESKWQPSDTETTGSVWAEEETTDMQYIHDSIVGAVESLKRYV